MNDYDYSKIKYTATVVIITALAIFMLSGLLYNVKAPTVQQTSTQKAVASWQPRSELIPPTVTNRPIEAWEAPTVTPYTNTPRPLYTWTPWVDTPVPPTFTPVPSATILPTNTPVPPSPTKTPMPTATPIPTRVPPTSPPVISGCPNGCTSSSPACLIKGNISVGSGEKIYHVPGQRYYASTVIDPKYGERWFCTEQEAKNNGWRKSSQ